MSDPSSVAPLWRAETQEPVPAPWRPPSRTGRIFTLMAIMFALTGAFTGLLFWIRTEPRPVLLPLWVTSYEARQLPSPAWASQDRAALADSKLFHLSTPPRGSARHQLLQHLNSLQEMESGESVVVYLSALAIVAGPSKVMILPSDAHPDDPATQVPLGAVLDALKKCPAEKRLLILDIMRPLVDARLGVLADDVATVVQQELAKARDDKLFVLCACAPGQVALSLEAMGRSVFSYYLEQGLRGAADGYPPAGKRDGQVSVRELGRSSVRAWTAGPCATGTCARRRCCSAMARTSSCAPADTSRSRRCPRCRNIRPHYRLRGRNMTSPCRTARGD
jgi:hypothetical protein